MNKLITNIYDFIIESKNTNKYYHGTTKTRADNIRKNGFYTQNNVNITEDYDEAMEYATYTSTDENDEPEVMTVTIRKGARPRARIGLDSMAYRSRDVISVQ